MAYFAYITRIKNLHAHPNADRLQIGNCFGNQVVVSLDYQDNQLGIYFPTDGQVSVEFAEYNNLLRKKDVDGNNIGGYMDPEKRNVKTVKLRGEPSDGLFLPLKSLEFTGADFSTLVEGSRIDILNGHEICKKYIPHGKQPKTNGNNVKGNRVRKKKTPIAPLFIEHADTEQLAYNIRAFAPGDEIEITLKMHGTSQRTGYLPKLQGFANKNPLWNQIIKKYYDKENIGKVAQRLLDVAMQSAYPVYDWGYVTGTRRTICTENSKSFYGSNEFREPHAKAFEGKLHKGEEVYYEVVGFVNKSTPIMGVVPNKRTNDKEFVKYYGPTTVFSYGCDPNATDLPISDFYVYRMTMTNEDGDIVEYTPDFMRYRCEQMGVKCVPLFCKAVIMESAISVNYGDHSVTMSTVQGIGEAVRQLAEEFYDGPDPIGKTHVREGVVVRIVNKPKFCAYKHKNISFKMIEGIFKEDAAAPDMEEAQEMETSIS